MSSELRSKKLRGSGGYVVASVTDEQQVKGNLGGPDLFLAPIGRLDDEKISKYFCNTCDKDFEGPPKIKFENPNEEVAENLILVEKGQYICSTCNMTIAEYRDFRKPDETQDIGSAKPIEPQATQPEAQPEPVAAAQPEPAAAPARGSTGASGRSTARTSSSSTARGSTGASGSSTARGSTGASGRSTARTGSNNSVQFIVHRDHRGKVGI